MKNEKLKCEVKNVIGILKKTIEKYLNLMKGGGGDCVTRRDFQTSADGAVAISEALGLMANAKGATLAHMAVAATAAARWGAVAVAVVAAAVVRRALTPKKMRAAASTKAIKPKMAAQTVGATSNS
jgi:hypothetical protein